MRGAYSPPEPTVMPPDVVYVKLDAATRHAWIVPEGMVVWAMARAEYPGRTDAWRPGDVQRMIALCRSMIDADLAGESPSPLARGAHHDPQGRLLVDSYGFDRLLDGGLAGPAATLLPSSTAHAITARIHALSRTPLRRLVVTLAADLEHDGDDDDETLWRDTVGTFVRARCVRGTESCSADTLYRAFVAWASTAAPAAGRRPLQRSGFWRTIALYAAHAFDVAGGAHVVSGLVLSHEPLSSGRERLASPRPRPAAVAGRSPRLSPKPARADPSAGCASKTEKKQDTTNSVPTKSRADDHGRLSVGRAKGDAAKSPETSTGARAKDTGTAVARGPSHSVRYDTSGYVAAIDLLHDAMGAQDAHTAKTIAGRIMYALRQRGWTFDKRRVGPGRATPLLRAVDVDAFLAASADIVGAGSAALSIAHYAETDAYVRLMTLLGQKRDPLGRRTAAVHARDSIAACVAAASATDQGLVSPALSLLSSSSSTSSSSSSSSSGRPQPRIPLGVQTMADTASPTSSTSSSLSPVDSLTRRRLRQQNPSAHLLPRPASLVAQSPSLSDTTPSHSSSSLSSSSPEKAVQTRVPGKRPRAATTPPRRVRRRIVPSTSDDDDDEDVNTQEDKQKDGDCDASDSVGHDASRHCDDNDDNGGDRGGGNDNTTGSGSKETGAPKEPLSDAIQEYPYRQRPRLLSTQGDAVANDGSAGAHREDTPHSAVRPFDEPRPPIDGRHAAEKAGPIQAMDRCPVANGITDEDALAQEARHNGALVDEMAARATSDLALCVWNRRAGLWRLVLAVRPGSDRQRPWRIIADHRTGSPQTSLAPSTAPTNVRWIEWSSVRSFVVDLVTTSAHTVLAVDADCEPPGDDPDVATVDVTSSWLFVVCRAWASGRWPTHAVAVPALALRMAEVAAADPDGTHAAEAVAIARACARRLREHLSRAASS
ncbi:hypothetical protein psal_cds_487 [Pandoravirus salinus]|uniref:Uncharacterized protein n=1 Tax=Pandoravirus salinus TaxID=1349410 RepID=S4VUN7_9VIRU|nr:hypothetical protein psal_cds_487 [Pandoravirus salinus]AGO84269.1 hypothetical protein psal_cds_487 [Pandoravirus salinus]